MFDPPEDVIAAIAAGQIVVITDDENRENEGDLVMAADAATPETINFMATHGRGLICVPLTKARANDLKLPKMTQAEDSFQTAFTVSVDAL